MKKIIAAFALALLAYVGVAHFIKPMKVYSNESPPEREQLLAAVRNSESYEAASKVVRPLCSRWIADYEDVIRKILAAGYSIDKYEHFSATSVDKPILYMRHDIHDRDIFGALCMMLVENDYNISASYYLLWDYDQNEIANRSNYILLKKMDIGRHEFGLHMSFADEYYYWENCKNNDSRKCLINFLKKYAASDEFKALSHKEKLVDGLSEKSAFPAIYKIKNQTLERILAYSKKRLIEHLDSMKSHFGVVTGLASHSGALGSLTDQIFKSDREIDVRYLASSHNFFSEEMLSQLGVKYETYKLQQDYKILGVSDSGIDIQAFDQRLNAALKTKKNVLMLMHPALWETKLIQSSRPLEKFKTSVSKFIKI
jgi:hypothetical protein